MGLQRYIAREIVCHNPDGTQVLDLPSNHGGRKMVETVVAC